MKISVFKFLARYYGITLNAALECSHTDLKRNFKFLKLCSREYANEHCEMVKNGNIIYVEDTNGVIKPYFCPVEVIVAENDCEYSRQEEEKDDFILEELSDMPTYLIGELLSKYKDKPSFYKIIRRELECRGVYENKKHKIDREISKMEFEESGLNDKYKRRRKIKCN